MENITILNYQGNKRSLLPFIKKHISNISCKEDTIVDIFSGAGSVSDELQDEYRVIANDSEPYASLITEALINTPATDDIKNAFSNTINKFNEFYSLNSTLIINKEKMLLKDNNNQGLISLYKSLPTVWNRATTPEDLRKHNDYNLFEYYYAGTYFGLQQSREIDSLIHAIHTQPEKVIPVLYASLFYALAEASFSKDGHLAQPLNPQKNMERHLKQRKKSVLNFFKKKLFEFIEKSSSQVKNNNVVFNSDFADLLNSNLLRYTPTVIYADPPYTDMQYSRYYHILNVAVNYNYPELTIYRGGYTKGLYTEGRNQSSLSKKSSALQSLKELMLFSSKNNIKLVLSYAFPQDIKKQNTDRYTITIETLINSAREIFGAEYVDIAKEGYRHANHRNSTTKGVFEYLIICGQKKTFSKQPFDVRLVRNQLRSLTPTSRNPLYNSHLYWSQKSYNVIDCLINGLSDKGDTVFDPFMGSGVTILEAIKNANSRIGIGCDVNELPIFISKTVLTDMFSPLVDKVLTKLQDQVQKLNKYYQFNCPLCGSQATVAKVVFDKPFRVSNDSVSIKAINFECPICKKQTINESDKVFYQMFNKSYVINNVDDINLIQDSKLAVGSEDHLSYIFTPRNYKVLDEIVGITKKCELPNLAKYILMSILHLAKITDMHSNSQWPLWIPKTNCVEKNVVTLFLKKLKAIQKTITYVKKSYTKDSLVSSYDKLSPSKARLLFKGSQFISNEDLPDNSVDLIVTDPPYMGQVAYSEYLQLYEPFTRLHTNMEDEIVVSSSPIRKEKNTSNYFTLLDSVFKLCSRKLKEDHYLSLFFHDSNLKVWNRLIEILERHGFYFVGQEHIEKKKTIKNILSPKKSLNGDAVLLFVNKKMDLSNVTNNDSIESIEISMYKDAKYLLSSGPKTTHELYDNILMNMLIENKWLDKFSQKYNSITDFLDSYFIWEKENSKWRLK